MMDRLKTWLVSLEPRERALVIGGAVAVLLLAIYVLALAPFYRSVEQRAARVERKQLDLVWMQGAVAQLQALAGNEPVAATDESLVVLVDRTSREAGLGSALTGQTPNGADGIRVRLESAAFDSVVLWLGSLHTRHGVSVESASIDRAGKPGLVNASLVLTRAAH